jgi:hypothetical protein
LGETGNPYRWGGNTEKFMRQSKIPNLEIYKLLPGRQLDGKSCPIFSFKDVLEHSKTDLFSHLQECQPEREPGLLPSGEGGASSSCTGASYGLKRIMPEFMKTYQMLDKIADYLESNPEFSSKTISPPLKPGTMRGTQPGAQPDTQSGTKTGKLIPEHGLEGRTLAQLLADSLVQIPTKGQKVNQQNSYVRKKAYKYYGVVLQTLLDESKQD